MEDLQGSSIYKRRMEIRRRIRKGQIEDYFQRRRQEFIGWGSSGPEHLRQLLQTPQNRLIYVDEIQKKLGNTSVNEWSSILQQIKAALPYFRQCCQPWVGEEGKVVKALYQGFTSQGASDNVKREIVGILTELMSCQQQKDEFVATAIYYFSVEEQVFNYLQQARLPTLSLPPFLHFFACLARSNINIRRKLLQIGTGQYLIRYGRELLQNQLLSQQERRNFMGMCADFTCPFKNGRRNTGSLAFIEPLVGILLQLVQMGGEEGTMSEGMYALCCISTVSNAITLPIFATRRFIRLNLDYSKASKCQSSTLTTLHILSRSDNKNVCKLLFEEGVLDVFWEISNQQPTRMSNSMIICSLVLLGIAELEIRAIVEHPIWTMVVKGLSSSNTIIKKEAFHCVMSLYFNADSSTLKKTIVDNQMVDTVMTNLTKFRDSDKEVLVGVLGLLKKYIQATAEEKDVRALHLLESIYRIDALLEDIMLQSNNDQVCSEAETISQIYSAAIMEDCGV